MHLVRSEHIAPAVYKSLTVELGDPQPELKIFCKSLLLLEEDPTMIELEVSFPCSSSHSSIEIDWPNSSWEGFLQAHTRPPSNAWYPPFDRQEVAAYLLSWSLYHCSPFGCKLTNTSVSELLFCLRDLLQLAGHPRLKFQLTLSLPIPPFKSAFCCFMHNSASNGLNLML